MRLAIVAVLAVGAVIVGSTLVIYANEPKNETWQEAIMRLESKIVAMDIRLGDLEYAQKLENNYRQFTITGTVYQDTNNNGKLDDNELGIPDMTVIKVAVRDHSDVERTTTASDGTYNFTVYTPESIWWDTIQADHLYNYLIQVEGGGPDAYSYIVLDYTEQTVYVNLPT